MSKLRWQNWTKTVGYIDKFLSTLSVVALALIIDQKAGLKIFAVEDSHVPQDFMDMIRSRDSPKYWMFWAAIAILTVVIIVEDRLSCFLNKGLAVDVDSFKALDYMRMWGIVNVFRIFRDGFCILTFGHIWIGLTIMIVRLFFLCIITLCMREVEAATYSKHLKLDSITTVQKF